jgi:ADP-heptose:LPS heptosyltransferase
MSDRPPRRVLLIQLQRLGDVLLSTPLLDDLHRAFPAARLDFLVGESAAPLLDNHPQISERHVLDAARPRRTWKAVISARYDWVLDVQSSPRTAPLTLLSGARARVGWRIRGPWKLVYTHTIVRGGHPAVYVPVQRQRFLQALGVPTATPRPRLYLTPEEHARGEAAVRALGVPRGSPVAGFVLSANLTKREWGVERFALAAQSLAADGVLPLVFHNPGDDAMVAQFRQLVPGAVVAQLPELRRLMSVIAACGVLISGDTGPAHIAQALDVPTVTIFGPSNPLEWSPGRPTTAVAHVPGSCLCIGRDRRMCLASHECMAAVTPAMVADAARALLGGRTPDVPEADAAGAGARHG